MGLKTGARPPRPQHNTRSPFSSSRTNGTSTHRTPPPARKRQHTAAADEPPSKPPLSIPSTSPIPPTPSSSSHPALKGFLPLLVQLHSPSLSTTPVPSLHPSPARCLFYRAHRTTGPDDELDAARTLFVVNVPFHYTPACLSSLFSCFGHVDHSLILPSPHLPPPSVSPSPSPTPSPHPYYRSARVIFASPSSLTTALTTDLSSTLQPSPPLPPSFSPLLRELTQGYAASLPDVGGLEEAVDRFMDGWDRERREEEEERRRGKGRGGGEEGGEGEEEGWTVVRRKRRRGGEEGEEVAMEELRRREERKRAKQASVSFYRSAKREQRTAQLEDLRKRFDEDRAKVAAMKASRKFNPV